MIINIKLIEFGYSLLHSMQIQRSARTVLLADPQTSRRWPLKFVCGPDVDYRSRVTCLVI